ncbi:MAG: M14 family zinc carboxypeptidase [Planctomycetota bacterium]
MRLIGVLSVTLLAMTSQVDLFGQGWRTRFETPFEKGDGWDSADYRSAIEFYRDLASESPLVTISEMGKTDSGFPLHLVLVARDQKENGKQLRHDPRSIMLINNAIHAGEPDGVDASMAFVRDLAYDEQRFGKILEDVIVAVIPVYSIGGALNRNSGTRANQNGPREYGFRGNARNYDLNRDFVKCDTLNARSFASIFQLLDPDLFIDTHVSNGADYQHVMTTSHSQKDKLGLKLGTYLHEVFEPKLFGQLRERGLHTIPYVNSGGDPPDKGFPQFLETPRYSTGFAALFQTMGFMTETHMLKPYPQRVEATGEFLRAAVELLAIEGNRIQEIREQDRGAYYRQTLAPLQWEVDWENPSKLEFHGYEANVIESRVTSGQRLRYDRNKPYVRDIRYFNNYTASQRVKLPAGYVIPRQWRNVIELMEINQVEHRVVDKAMNVSVEAYRIEDVKSRATPYEGHHFHDVVKLSTSREEMVVRPGDVIVPIKQDRARYVVEMLEPQAVDSLFRWNFFDTILQRKEYFSPYVFEDAAEKMLAEDPKLRSDFESRKRDDEQFASDPKTQLQYLYQRSAHYEKAHRRYPVARLLTLPES